MYVQIHVACFSTINQGPGTSLDMVTLIQTNSVTCLTTKKLPAISRTK